MEENFHVVVVATEVRREQRDERKRRAMDAVLSNSNLVELICTFLPTSCVSTSRHYWGTWSLATVSEVCKVWSSASSTNGVWRSRTIEEFPAVHKLKGVTSYKMLYARLRGVRQGHAFQRGCLEGFWKAEAAKEEAEGEVAEKAPATLDAYQFMVTVKHKDRTVECRTLIDETFDGGNALMFPSWAHLGEDAADGVQETRLEGVEYSNPCWNVGEFPTDWLVEWANTVPNNDGNDVAAAVAAAAAEPDAENKIKRLIGALTDAADDNPFPDNNLLTLSIVGFRAADQHVADISHRVSISTKAAGWNHWGCPNGGEYANVDGFRFLGTGSAEDYQAYKYQAYKYSARYPQAFEDDTIPVTEFQAPHRRESIFLDLSADKIALCAELGPRKDGPGWGLGLHLKCKSTRHFGRYGQGKGVGYSYREMILSGDQLLEFLARQNWA